MVTGIMRGSCRKSHLHWQQIQSGCIRDCDCDADPGNVGGRAVTVTFGLPGLQGLAVPGQPGPCGAAAAAAAGAEGPRRLGAL